MTTSTTSTTAELVPSDIARAFRARVYARRQANPLTDEGNRVAPNGFDIYSASYRANQLFARACADGKECFGLGTGLIVNSAGKVTGTFTAVYG